MENGFTNMRDMTQAFANAMNLISSEMEDHHEKVAYVAYRLAEQVDLTEQERKNIIYGALLHDIGVVTQSGIRNISLVELESKVGFLSKAGSALLRMNPITSPLAEVVSESQTPWKVLRSRMLPLRGALLMSQIIHMADVVTLLLQEQEGVPVLNRISKVREAVRTLGKQEFSPTVLKAFDAVCGMDYVWMDLFYQPDRFLDFISDSRDVSLDETIRLTELVSHIIDFRSPFTAMHSAGVAAAAEELARLSGMSQNECKMMRIAGNLHDLGKLKIPKKILDKPGKLTDEEFNQVKEHAYYTGILLENIHGFDQIAQWAGLHHEKLNGKGYPFGLSADQLPLGSRIMAAADIFSAITEERPYRKGMPREKAISVLRENVRQGALAGNVVELLIENYDRIDGAREAASHAAGKHYFASLEEQSKE